MRGAHWCFAESDYRAGVGLVGRIVGLRFARPEARLPLRAHAERVGYQWDSFEGLPRDAHNSFALGLWRASLALVDLAAGSVTGRPSGRITERVEGEKQAAMRPRSDGSVDSFSVAAFLSGSVGAYHPVDKLGRTVIGNRCPSISGSPWSLRSRCPSPGESEAPTVILLACGCRCAASTSRARMSGSRTIKQAWAVRLESHRPTPALSPP